MKWLSETFIGDVLALRIGREGETLVAEWPELGILRAQVSDSPRATSHSFTAAAHADPPTVDKLKRGVVRALLRHLDGELSLHASAVAVDATGDENRSDDAAVVFIGASGTGKSTFAAYLGSRGYAVLADDVAHLDRVRSGAADTFYVQPSEDAHFLLQDACIALGLPADQERAKTRVPARRVGSRTRLAAMFAFEDDTEVRVTRISGFETIERLSPCVARFVFDDPAVLRGDLERLGALLASVPLYRIGRPRGFEHLAVIEQRMLDVVGG